MKDIGPKIEELTKLISEQDKLMAEIMMDAEKAQR